LFSAANNSEALVHEINSTAPQKTKNALKKTKIKTLMVLIISLIKINVKNEPLVLFLIGR
jgi:hypothetical protein